MTWERLPRSLLETDACGAALAQLWYEGVLQRQLARVFGYAGSTPACQSIRRFMAKYCDVRLQNYWGEFYLPQAEDLKPLVPAAIARYRETVSRSAANDSVSS